MIENILVPIDFSKNSVDIFKYAQKHTNLFEAKTTVLYVAESLKAYEGFAIPHLSLPKLEDELIASAERKMEFFLEDCLDQLDNYEGIVLLGEAAESIVDYANKASINLIIMGTHGHKGIEKVLFGSVAKRVVENAPCPVLTINPYKKY